MFTLQELINSKLKKGIEITIPIIQDSQKSEEKIKQLSENSTSEAINKFKEGKNKQCESI